jgi:hypothetical protein
MKAKEKAEQLINSFYYALPNNGRRTGLNSTTIRFKEATVCALIAVDEIIKAGKDVDEFADSYWQEVKQEIEQIGGDK